MQSQSLHGRWAPGSWKGLVVDVAWMWMFVGVLTLIGDQKTCVF